MKAKKLAIPVAIAFLLAAGACAPGSSQPPAEAENQGGPAPYGHAPYPGFGTPLARGISPQEINPGYFSQGALSPEEGEAVARDFLEGREVDYNRAFLYFNSQISKGVEKLTGLRPYSGPVPAGNSPYQTVICTDSSTNRLAEIWEYPQGTITREEFEGAKGHFSGQGLNCALSATSGTPEFVVTEGRSRAEILLTLAHEGYHARSSGVSGSEIEETGARLASLVIASEILAKFGLGPEYLGPLGDDFGDDGKIFPLDPYEIGSPQSMTYNNPFVVELFNMTYGDGHSCGEFSRENFFKALPGKDIRYVKDSLEACTGREIE